MFNYLLDIIVGGLTYDLLKVIVGSLIMTAALTFLIKLLKKFETYKDILYFSLASFIALFSLLFIITPKTQGPQLAGGIQTVVTGNVNSGHDTLAIFTMSVLNSGSMQSIIKNWTVSATVNGRAYDGVFMVPPPKDFTFTTPSIGLNSPTGITYHGDDSLLVKAMTPIPTGGQVTGTLFVLFRDVDATIFKVGADFTVDYEDALSRKYSAKAASTAKFTPMAMAVGVHADLVCPAPPPGAPL